MWKFLRKLWKDWKLLGFGGSFKNFENVIKNFLKNRKVNFEEIFCGNWRFLSKVVKRLKKSVKLLG